MQDYRVKAFKRRLENYDSNLKEIQEINEQIEYLYYLLGGVRGLDPSKEPIHSAVKNLDKEYEMRDKISSLEKEKARLRADCDYIENILEHIDDKIKKAIVRIYVNREKVFSVAREIGYSDNGLLFVINREIKKALRI